MFPRANYQRWSPRRRPWPRGHILKSLALASKPQVLENCPVLGSRTALFFEPLKFCWKTAETLRKICEDLFFVFLKLRSPEKKFFEDLFRLKKFFEDLFFSFLENTWACVLGWPWPRNFFVSLASSLLSSTPSLLIICQGSRDFSKTTIALVFTER